jgi:hypothetical protein
MMDTQDAYDEAVATLTQEQIDAIWNHFRTSAPLDEAQIIDALEGWRKVGSIDRDTGAVCPYKAGTLAYYMHGCGWLRRDLQLALCRSNEGYRRAQIACGQVKESDL